MLPVSVICIDVKTLSQDLVDRFAEMTVPSVLG